MNYQEFTTEMIRTANNNGTLFVLTISLAVIAIELHKRRIDKKNK